MVAAIVMSDWGSPDVLVPADVEVGAPRAGQILLQVSFAGVGPTDLAIRAGRLKGAFGSAPGSVLGFEAAGTVLATGDGVTDVAVGDAVVAFLPGLGGYGEQVLATHWVRRPDSVDEHTAAGLPASGEAAVRVVQETGVGDGDVVLVVGAAGSVGLIAAQLAVARGARVLGVVRTGTTADLPALGVTPVVVDGGLADAIRRHVPSVDVVIDAAGSGVLAEAVDLAGGPDRVVTLSDPRAAGSGVRLSGPDEPRIKERLATAMSLLAQGRLTLRPHTVFPLADAAQVHRELEAGRLRTKALLATAS